MQIFCIENEHLDPAARYAIDFMLERSGFFYRWVQNEPSATEMGIILTYGKRNSRLPLPSLHLPRAYNPTQLNTAKPEWREFSVNDHLVPVLGLNTSSAETISFDIVATVFFFLSRMEEGGFRHPDDVDKRYRESLLFRYGAFRLPVVDILAKWLKERIEEIFRRHKLPWLLKSPFPHGHRMGLALTHDVDITRAANPLKTWLLKRFSDGKKQAAEQAEADIWAFDRLLPFYRERGWRATFNFLARPWEDTHYRYHVTSRRFRRLINRMQEEGHEIGLHPSRYAFEHPHRYVKEKKRLEKITGRPVKGMRQHYLRALFPALWRTAEQLGLQYDATLAYRRAAGYRAGTGAPFTCFDHRENRILNCLEFPTAFFESSLPEEGKSTDPAVETIHYFFDTAQTYRGVLTVLWHPSNMYSHALYKRLWQEITGFAESYCPFIAPLAQQAHWQESRRRIRLSSVKKNTAGCMVTIENPASFPGTGLLVYGGMARSAKKDKGALAQTYKPDRPQEVEINSDTLCLELVFAPSTTADKR